MVRAVLEDVCRPQEVHHGLGWAAGERKLVFYADGVRIAGREPDWVQDSLSVTVYMFFRDRLETNLDKTKAMVFTPGFIGGQIREEAYKRRETGYGAAFKERKPMRASLS